MIGRGRDRTRSRWLRRRWRLRRSGTWYSGRRLRRRLAAPDGGHHWNRLGCHVRARQDLLHVARRTGLVWPEATREVARVVAGKGRLQRPLILAGQLRYRAAVALFQDLR